MKKKKHFSHKERNPQNFVGTQGPFDDLDSEYITEILYEDDFEDRPLKQSRHSRSPSKSSKRLKRSRGILDRFLAMKRWKKVVLCVVTALVVVITGLTGSFFYLRAQGEKNLKTQVTSNGESEDDDVGLFVTYNGKKYQYNEDVINFLCLGIDKETPIESRREAANLANGSAGLADAIIVVSINVESGKIRFLAIPRDTVTTIKVVGRGGKYIEETNMQITTQHAYGQNATQACELMVETVSKLLYQVPIQRYCSINLAAIPVLNDAVGGVDVQVLEDVEGGARTYHSGETIHLEGDMAREYIQARDCGVDGSSIGRLNRQKQYITNYFAKAKETVKNDLSLPLTVYNSLQEDMCTNITPEDIAYLVPEILGMSLNAEDMTTIPGEAIMQDEHLQYIPNIDQLKATIIDYFYKEIS